MRRRASFFIIFCGHTGKGGGWGFVVRKGKKVRKARESKGCENKETEERQDQ